MYRYSVYHTGRHNWTLLWLRILFPKDIIHDELHRLEMDHNSNMICCILNTADEMQVTYLQPCRDI